jgi:hypothetical protein
MTSGRWWQGASRRLILSFVFVLVMPAAAVVWLGVRLVDQDRAVAARQLRERREAAAERVIGTLQQAVAISERRLAGDPDAFPFQRDDDALLVTLEAHGVDTYPRHRLLYLPVLPDAPDEPTVRFEAGESLEFRALDYAGAARPIARTSPPDLRGCKPVRCCGWRGRFGNPRAAMKRSKRIRISPGSLMRVCQVCRRTLWHGGRVVLCSTSWDEPTSALKKRARFTQI